MTLRNLLIAFTFLPSPLLGQNAIDISNCKISNTEIYSIINLIIKREKLNKQYGIELNPYKNTNIAYTDERYLQTFLIKPFAKDTIKRDSSSRRDLVSPISYPDKSILTQADIDYILCSQKNLNQFMWDNKKLGFATNQKSRYSFSVPFFNLTHDKIIMAYEFLCPGLCGTGKSILLNRKKGGWEITSLEIWFH